MALLPRALYGCSHVVIGDHWYPKLRTSIVRALAIDRAGASPVLRSAFVTSLSSLDPSYVVAWTIVQDVITAVQRNAWFRSQWISFFWSTSSRRTYGPFAAFLRVCEPSFLASA